MYSVSLKKIIKEFGLTILTENVDIDGKLVETPEINRPALQLAGFFEYFDSERLQVIGIVEYTYLSKMSPEKREETLQKIFSHKIPAVVMCRGLDAFPEMIDYASKNNVPILQTDDTTSDFMSEIIRWLNVQLAPRMTMHGVLVDVYGEGILIIGESGIGKSEVALELIKRGHRLVADDAVEVKRVSHETVVGSCPGLIRDFIEVRGVGVINVKQMFGVQSVKEAQGIDLIIKFENWEKGKQYDRLGLEAEYMDVLGNQIVCQTIPVRPGRNLAMICESAAISRRQKKMGYNAAQDLSERIMGGKENFE
ncbi:MAG: HPr(Ser) kinase/phosphatase [Clostridiales bacterium]|nr:HPr(Ser) kinase/phosphatase [Clostridiales bacterium]